MTSCIFVTIACCLVSGLLAQTDYCKTTYCRPGLTNVGCNPPPASGGASCTGKSPAVVVMDSNLQTLILSEHNTRRSKFALGQLAPFLPATRMPTITWDTELANQAGNNARSCVYGHDSCRNTAMYLRSGQNIAFTMLKGITKTAAQLIKESINSWWSEYSGTTQSQLNSYPSGFTRPGISRFTQMVNDQTAKIGCAMQYWLQGQEKTYYFVCNYSSMNVFGTAVYKAGKATSGCTTGRNPTAALSGLCSPAEKIVPVYN
ncbi:antigen 5 like allergen Cul n 1-like [Anopheles moucheti]|uniref:antigen 5 like allergen Cul n 1-like n=1 Tax=Anopheles moucheti TaxID=186751 RepID=UPI0022F107F2|nr:antigen 5 like allergen Cul n 1-like [Anopheles moucheti]